MHARSRLLSSIAFSIAASWHPVEAAAQTSIDSPRPEMVGFGGAVAVVGDYVLVGRPGVVPGFPSPSAQSGGVHLFRRGTGDRWTEVGMLAAKDAAIGDGFGLSIAADGSLLAVGAPEANDKRGAVYVFERTKRDTWTQRARLTAPSPTTGGRFGAAIALQGDVLIAGLPGDSTSSGKVIAFRRDRSAASWKEQGVLQGSGTQAGDRFGVAVSLDRGAALIGASGPPGSDSTKWRRGAAYVFRAGESAWTEEGMLQPLGDSARVAWGRTVRLDGNEALVSSWASDSGAGKVVRFARGGDGRWTEMGSLSPATPEYPALFGAAYARDGDDLLVGAPLAGKGIGSVHVLRRDSTGSYKEVQVLETEANGFGTQLGYQIAAAGGVAAVGAPQAGFFEGEVHIYTRDSAGGQWRERATVVDTLGDVMASVTGGEVKCKSGKARNFECRDADLVSFLSTKAIGAKRGVLINDLWGWTDASTGREFALVGRTDGTAFVEVTDPAKPVFLGSLPLTEGSRSNIWRDIKVYRNHAYIVADGAGPHGIQIFDLTQLRHVSGAPVTFKETAHYDKIFSAHNIAIDTASGYAFTIGNSMGGETCGGGLHMVDIREPENPKFAGCQADPTTGRARSGYIHDAQCVVYQGPDAQYKGHEVCFNASETALGIADVTDKNAPKPLSTAAYPNVSYAHQGWLSEDHRYFYLDDEGDEIDGTAPTTRTVIFDVGDLDDPVVVKEFYGTTAATDHNLYVRGHYVYESNYVAGLRVLDVKDPVNPVEVGYFDTVPLGKNEPGFAGSWSNYPFFKSGIVAVTSMHEGLFLIRSRPSELVP